MVGKLKGLQIVRWRWREKEAEETINYSFDSLTKNMGFVMFQTKGFSCKCFEPPGQARRGSVEAIVPQKKQAF